MLADNQSLTVHPYEKGLVLALETNTGKEAILITKHVEYPGDDSRYVMAIESAIIYLQKKTENAEY